MQKTSIKLILASLMGSTVLVGCAAQTPYMDERFGETVNSAKALQTINPDASLNTDPVAGIDGPAADAAIVRYHESYTNPPAPANVFTIGVGGGGGGK